MFENFPLFKTVKQKKSSKAFVGLMRVPYDVYSVKLNENFQLSSLYSLDIYSLFEFYTMFVNMFMQQKAMLVKFLWVHVCVYLKDPSNNNDDDGTITKLKAVFVAIMSN